MQTQVELNKLQQIKSELELWRSQQTGRKKIPQHLWDKAFDLLNSYSVGTISRELRLDYHKLKQHLQPTRTKSARQSCKPKRAFLELAASELANTASQTTDHSNSIILPQSTQACRIIFERSDGSKLTLDLPMDVSMIEAICNGFLRG